MIRVRLAAAAFGVAFGFLISWGQFTDPDRIRDMLLLEDPYLYLMMFSAIAVAFAGTWLLRRLSARALLTGEPLSLDRSKPERRHLVGAALFGLGWAISDSCPAPIAGQLAQGVFWSTFTIVGIVLGILLFLRTQEKATRRAKERAESVDSHAPSAAVA
jgi:uncharacterized membrane protein YedE/YeeE